MISKPSPKSLAWSTALALFATPLAAQTAPAPSAAAKPGETIKLEAFTVTGSNIRRAESEAALPVTSISRDDLDLRAASTPANLLETLPFNDLSTLNEQAENAQNARGDNASANLRGLGTGSTLVLVNGRRVPANPITQVENGTPSLSVNINTVPSGLSSRVEILRDGASAIYGSDAAAGVINFIVEPRFDGLRTVLRGAVTQDGGGDESRFTLTWGDAQLNGGKTRVSLGLDYLRRDAIRTSDRWYSSQRDLRLTHTLPAPWNGLPVTSLTGAVTRDNDFQNSDALGRYGYYTRGIANPDGSITSSRPTANRGINTATTTTTQSPAAAMSTTGAFYLVPLATGTVGFHPSATVPSANIDSPVLGYYLNNNQGAYLVPKTDRLNLVASFDHRLSSRLTVFGDLFVYHAKSKTGRFPVQIDANDTFNLSVGVDNPFNLFGSRFYHPTGLPNADGTPRLAGTPSPVVINGLRPGDHLNRNIFVTSISGRASAGLRGKLGDRWEWESALLYGAATTKDAEDNNIRESKLAAALQSSATATAYNPFGFTFRLDPVTNFIVIDKAYRNPAPLMASISDTSRRQGWTGLGIADLKINGRIGELFGNGVAAAAGIEARYESFKFRMPAYAGRNPADDPNPYLRPGDNDFVFVSPGDNSDLNRKVYSAFAEVLLPFITPRNQVRLVRQLDLSLAARLENYPVFGNVTKPKASLDYVPVRGLKIRASVNEAFKAPNLLQTDPIRRQILGTAEDPYRFAVTGAFTDSSTRRTTFRPGNPNLKPEESVNATAGLVVDVPFVKGLSFTADFWKANQNNVVDSIPIGDQLLLDEELLDAETRRQLAQGVPMPSVNLGSGTAAYKGNPLVQRAAVSPADQALFNTFNANPNNANQHRAAVGSVINVAEEFVNTSGRDLEGIDFGAEYRVPRSQALGNFTLRGDASYRHKHLVQATPGAALVEQVGTNGNAQWRFNASLRWQKGPFSAGWLTNYYGTWMDTSASTTQAVFEALGQPDYINNTLKTSAGATRYLLKVQPNIVHNLTAGYRFDRRHAVALLRGTAVRIGVNDVFNRDPRVADEDYGYRSGTFNPRGRQYWLELSKAW